MAGVEKGGLAAGEGVVTPGIIREEAVGAEGEGVRGEFDAK